MNPKRARSKARPRQGAGQALTRSESPDTLRGGRRKVAPSTSAPRSSGAIDSILASMVRLCYAIDLVGQALDEGPLRTKVLELTRATQAATTEALAERHAQYDKGRTGTVRASEADEGSFWLDGSETLPEGDLDVDG